MVPPPPPEPSPTWLLSTLPPEPAPPPNPQLTLATGITVMPSLSTGSPNTVETFELMPTLFARRSRKVPLPVERSSSVCWSMLIFDFLLLEKYSLCITNLLEYNFSVDNANGLRSLLFHFPGEDLAIYPCIKHTTEEANCAQQAHGHQECKYGLVKMIVKQCIA